MNMTTTRTQPWIQGEIDRLIDLRTETHDPTLKNEYTLQIRELSAEWDAIENQPMTDRLHQGPRTDLLKSEIRTINEMGKVVASISSTATSLLSCAYSAGDTDQGYRDHHGDNARMIQMAQKLIDLNTHWLAIEQLTVEIEGMLPAIRNIDHQ